METTPTEQTKARPEVPDAAFGEDFAALSEGDKQSLRRCAALLVEKTVASCDRIALEYPDYAETLGQIKADLLRLPSAGHAACAIRALLDIAQGTYDDFDDADALTSATARP